jgi:hypothetical protein
MSEHTESSGEQNLRPEEAPLADNAAVVSKAAALAGVGVLATLIAKDPVHAALITGGMQGLTEIFFGFSIKKWADNWGNRALDAIRYVAKRQDSPVEQVIDRLQQDDAFIGALLQATQYASRTSQEEKLVALQNALTNMALGLFPNVDRRSVFLRMIDDLTKEHIQILELLHDPVRYFDERGKFLRPYKELDTVSLIMHASDSDVEGDEEYLTKLLHDLETEGLVGTPSHSAATGGATTSTGPGRELLAFIRPPDYDDMLPTGDDEAALSAISDHFAECVRDHEFRIIDRVVGYGRDSNDTRFESIEYVHVIADRSTKGTDVYEVRIRLATRLASRLVIRRTTGKPEAHVIPFSAKDLIFGYEKYETAEALAKAAAALFASVLERGEYPG